MILRYVWNHAWKFPNLGPCRQRISRGAVSSTAGGGILSAGKVASQMLRSR